MNKAARDAAEVTRLARAWCGTHLDCFFQNDALGKPNLLSGLKPLGELLIACHLSDHTAESKAPLDRTTVARLWRHIEEGEALERLLREEPDATPIVVLTALFAKLGKTNQELCKTIDRWAQLRSTQSLELRPWERLELATALESLGLTPPISSRKAFEATWLAREPEAWTLTTRGAYYVTHTIFHMTAFGRRPERLPDSTRAYLSRWLPVWIAFAGQTKNDDLLAELVMCAAFLGIMETLTESFERLAARLVRLEASSGKRSARASFRAHYHLVLVSAMAGLAAQRQIVA